MTASPDQPSVPNQPVPTDDPMSAWLATLETPENSPCGEAKSSSQLLDACIHCGLCLTSCPTYIATGNEAESPRGRLYLMRQWESGRITEPEDLATHLDHCLGCLNCQTACPSGVQYGTLLNHYRAELLPQRERTLVQRLKRFGFQYILPNRLMTEAVAWGLRFYRYSGLRWLVRKTGVLKPFPKLANMEAKAPTVGLKPSPSLKPGQRFGPKDGPLIALHIGCLMDAVFRPVHWATIKVLTANGYQVVIPEQGCCGALAHHAGEVDLAKRLIQRNLMGLLADPDIEAVVFNSAGCGAELRHEAVHLFEPGTKEHEQALALSAKVKDISEVLAQQPLAPMTQPVEAVVTYHAACHLSHAQGVRQQPIDLLQQVPGLTLVPLTEQEACCGSAGIYNLEQPELADKVLRRKLGFIQESKAQWVATGNPGCHLQLQSELPAGTVYHPIEILAMAYEDKQ